MARESIVPVGRGIAGLLTVSRTPIAAIAAPCRSAPLMARSITARHKQTSGVVNPASASRCRERVRHRILAAGAGDDHMGGRSPGAAPSRRVDVILGQRDNDC